MKIINKNLYFFFLVPIIFFSFRCNAAHLVGGDISYTCMGNNLYSIKLRMYRDCAGGGANFDNIARVAIYDVDSNLIDKLEMTMGAIVSVSSRYQDDPCITIPASLCVEYTEYNDTITLPPIDGGYTLVHQRCCRNSNIQNVISPETYGNTYSIEIPSMDTTCNSSVEFNGDVDLLTCVGEEAVIPLQYTELDGDSVSFQFCQIFHGGGQQGGAGCEAVIPDPPCPPPFDPLTFISPQSFVNPIPSNPAFKIDSVTGEIRGVPTAAGNYVLGICATEWRDGQILSTTRLDYQLAVTTCIQNVVSDMVTPIEKPQILCNGLTVEFESETVNAQGVKWDFGDTTTMADTSLLDVTTYTFPEPGNYVVTLIANPGLECADTTTEVFRINPPVIPNFFIDGVYCLSANTMDFEPVGYYPDNAIFKWDFGQDAVPSSYNGFSPTNIYYQTEGVKSIILTVEWDGVCSESGADTVSIEEYTFFINAYPDTVEIYRGDEFNMTVDKGSEYYWYSNRPVEMRDRYGQNTTAQLRDEDDTVTFYVVVTDFDGCEGLDSVKVFVTGSDAEPVYNFFTPNQDGLNDFFDLSHINPSGNCKFTVLNRWGSEVYRVEAYKNDWTGLDQDGNPLPDGTYYFIMQCGDIVQAKGPVTILKGFN